MKKYTTIILGLITTVSLFAQDRNQYLSLTAGGGLHSLRYSLQDGSVKGGPGGVFNLGYSYFFNPGWGINTGFGIQSAQSVGTLNFIQENEAIDADGDNFILRSRYNSWKEKQNSLFIDIPLGLQYQHWCNENLGILASAGVKASIPFASKYKVKSGSIAITGYYPQWDVELADMPQHGFSTYSEKPDGNLNLKTSLSLYSELGVLYKLSQKYDLYAGGYFNYGINNIADAAGHSVYQPDGTYNGMISSYRAGSVKLLTVGIKAGIRLNFGRSRKTEQLPVVSQVPVAEQSVPAETPEPVPVPAVKEEPKPETVVVPEPVYDPYPRARELSDTIHINFQLNTAVPVNDGYDNEFRELAGILKSTPEMKIVIQGHTCNLGSKDVNQRIGMLRAEAGKERLMKYGVPASQIITETKGFDDPLVPNNSKENRAKNRRIVLVIE
jgi:OmpA-OmpF porin, OOP family